MHKRLIVLQRLFNIAPLPSPPLRPPCPDMLLPSCLCIACISGPRGCQERAGSARERARLAALPCCVRAPRSAPGGGDHAPHAGGPRVGRRGLPDVHGGLDQGGQGALRVRRALQLHPGACTRAVLGKWRRGWDCECGMRLGV